MLESLTSLWGGAVVVVSVLFAGYQKLFRFYTSSYVPRKLNLYDRLKESASENPQVKNVIGMAADEEIFRIVFGQGGSPEYRKALVKLYETDKFGLRELQLSKSCLGVSEPDQSKKTEKYIVSKFGFFDKLSLVVLSVVLAFSALFFSAIVTQYLSLKTTAGYISSVVALVFFAITFFMLGSELIRLLVSRRVCRRLDKINATEAVSAIEDESA